MSRPVRVLTDSTAGLPATVVAEHALLVVPMTVSAGGRTGAEGTEITAADVEAALRSRLELRTAHPGPAAFATALAAAGDADVVAVHLSSALSGTAAAAEHALGGAGAVVDSRTCGMGLGLVALAAADEAAAGGSVEAVVAAARAAMARTNTLFYVESLEALRRGGRIGAASALLGSALAVKPLLRMADGVVEPVEKVRTSSRALARLQALAVESAGDGPADLAVMHLAAADRAAALAERLRAELPAARDVYLTELSAAVGAHTGLGALGVAVSRR